MSSAEDLIATRIERLRVRPEDGRAPFTVLLDIEWERGEYLYGHEVETDGSKAGRLLADGTEVTRDHLIARSMVTRRTRMWMNRKYGELEAGRSVPS